MKAKKNRKWLGIALSFSLLTGTVSCFSTGNTSQAQEPPKKLIVYVAAQGESSDGNTKVELPKTAVQAEEGMTAKEVICQALDASQYKDNYVISENNQGGSLDAIGGLATPEDYSLHWTFNVNGTSSDLGIGSYQVQNQDKISLLYGASNAAKTECDCYVKKESDNPGEAAQAALLISAKEQRDLLAEKIYQINFKNGAYIPGIEDTDSLYSVFSLVQSGYHANAFYDNVAQRVCTQLAAMENLSAFYNETTGENMSQDSYENSKYGIINYTKIALFLSSVGKDITTAGNMDLTKKITSKALYEAANPTPISRDAMILLVMDASGAEWSTGEEYVTRAELIDAVLADVDTQLGTSIAWASYDSAAMIIQALAPYRTAPIPEIEQEKINNTTVNCGIVYPKTIVNTAIENVLAFLSEMQQSNGGYLGYGAVDDIWTLAQVMTTLGVMNINPVTDTSFIRNGKTVIDASSAYVNTAKKTVSDSLVGGENAYQPEQLLRGLTSCVNVMTNTASIYDTTQPLYTATDRQPEVTLTKPSIKKLSTSGKKLTIKFNTVKNAKKYTVEIATDKAFKKNVQKKTVTTTTTTFKKLKSGKKYFVRVRAAKGNVKSPWSAVKSKQIK